jgi:peptide/nickel transport system substrate-binding protein
MRRRLVALPVGALAVALVASGCSKTTEDTGGGAENKSQTGTIGTAEDSKGPAKEVEGGKKGGIITLLHQADFEHLDPQKNYVSDSLSMGVQLYRPLTGYKEDGKGNLKLVGDLATDPGQDVNGDCKTWKYTLKQGIKFEDGTEVKAKDVEYGIARSFDPDWGDGPTYLQQWLADNPDYSSAYNGPFKSADKPVPGVQVNGDYEITFTFAKPRCETPYAVGMPTSAPVPKAKDTKADYDLHPISTGPYMIKNYKVGEVMELVRNPNWDAQTDPIRNAYPDGFTVRIGVDAETAANRLIADAGEDQTALTWQNVPAALIPKAEPLKEQVKAGPTQYLEYLYINTQRVTDKKVREALNWAMNRDAILKVRGGIDQFGASLISPTVAGYKNYNAFDAGPTGDPNKAKELLGGKTVKLVYAFPNTPPRVQVATKIKEVLAPAGFDIVLNPLDPATYYATVGQKNNKFDLIRGGWGADWPSASTVIPPVFDGRTIRAQGNQDLSYMNDPAVNAEIDRIQGLKAKDAEAAWAALDEKIMKDVTPVVPLYYIGAYEMHGSRIAGTFLSDSYGHMTLNTIYVK